jgi:hypothetical protein
MAEPRIDRGADCAAVQSFVLRCIGGRAYRRHVEPAIRLTMMRTRAPLDRKTCAVAAMCAHAVYGYLSSIGDKISAARWGELSADLNIVAAERCRMNGRGRFWPWELGKLPDNWQPLGRILAGAA